MVVFYCDLAKQTCEPNISSSSKLERLQRYSELSAADLHELTAFWNPKQALRNIEERFEKGASLWLIRYGDRIVAYGWTLRGRTIEPNYFPLGPDDVHFFDFHVYPAHRGRGLNPLLVKHILSSVARETDGRAFIEVAEWNRQQLASLKKTPFRRLGLVRKMTSFGHTFTSWTKNQLAVGACMEMGGKESAALTVAKSHEQ
jgi:ribosomal protein S18 acetylase RimI-like enzyme